MKIKVAEGMFFATPLRNGGIAVGLIVRANRGIVISYFFGPQREILPSLDELENLRASDSLIALRSGDASIAKAEWTVIGNLSSFNRSDWPMPIFVQRDELSRTAVAIQYHEDDISKVLEPVLINYDVDLPLAGLYGAGAVELLLAAKLSRIN